MSLHYVPFRTPTTEGQSQNPGDFNQEERARPLGKETDRDKDQGALHVESPMIVGQSQAMQNVFSLIRTVAHNGSIVLISGESGSGKELVARAIHFGGERRNRPFLAINCTAIPEHLLESELFGHVRGSFTGAISDKKGLFEEAEGGTLFLDEIGDLSPNLQVKLLRVLQDREIRPVGGNRSRKINVRFIAATHRDLKTLIKEGSFREDLFYRINVVPVRVPPLRERKEDIPLLIENFVKKFARAHHRPIPRIVPATLQALRDYRWPGNVRELENVIERMTALSTSDVIANNILMESISDEPPISTNDLIVDRPTLAKLEERYIKMVLEEVGHRKQEAAHVLGISRRTLHRKERLYGSLDHFKAFREHNDTNETTSLEPRTLEPLRSPTITTTPKTQTKGVYHVHQRHL